MKEYTKYKECSPEETIFRIRQILREAGLHPVLKWVPDEFRGVCSNRVYLDPVTGLGTNGKGTSERYAEASAFAELMERLQNNLLHIKNYGSGESPWKISAAFPDEKEMTFDELIDQKDAYLENLFHTLNFEMRFQQEAFLQKIASGLYGKDDGRIPVIPFADVKSDRIIWLPSAAIISFCGSNGMCAGNNMEEALVQGISEILERYAQSRVIKESLTPPPIPAEELEQYSLWPLIQQIEETGRYKVSIRDCSLGEGLPVTAVVIADREKNSFGVKFGCHPSFPISVERTLTEAFQGKRLEYFTSTNAIGSEDQIFNYDNFANTTKTGNGFYPAALFGSTPSWEYRPWTQWESCGNREYLKKLLALLDGKGLAPLIRDASHLGFPAYFVLVPGISEMFEVSSLRLRDIQTNVSVKDFFGHFPDLSEKEEELLLRLIMFKQGSIIENGLDIISGRFLKGDLFIADRVGAYLAFKMERYQVASSLFRRAAAMCQKEEDRRYMNCLSELARYLGTGVAREDALSATEFLFGEEPVQKAAWETEDPHTMLEKVFPRLQCFDCDNCSLAGVHCEYPEAAGIIRKINKALADSKVSQEQLLDELSVVTREKEC